jgi:hypothetical protein
MLTTNLTRQDRPQDDGPGEPSYTTRLFIPYDVTDTGIRPVPQGVTYWRSPYISFSPTDALGMAIPGQHTSLKVYVRNDGYLDAVGVTVEWLVCKPTLAGVIPIGGKPLDSLLVNVPKGPPTQFTCPVPWFPDYSQGAHQCLIARCGMPGDNFPAANALAANLDLHVAQHNLDIHDPSANPGSPKKMTLAAGNPFNQGMSFEIRATILWIRGAFDVWPRNDPTGLPQFLAGVTGGDREQTPLEKRLQLSVHDVSSQTEGPFLMQTHKPNLASAHHVSPLVDPFATLIDSMRQAPDATETVGGKQIGIVELGRGQTASLELVTPMKPIGENEAIAYHLTQTSSGVAVGGYTLLVIRPRRG